MSHASVVYIQKVLWCGFHGRSHLYSNLQVGNYGYTYEISIQTSEVFESKSLACRPDVKMLYLDIANI